MSSFIKINYKHIPPKDMTEQTVCPHKFLDLFEYQSSKLDSAGVTQFFNCRMLRDFGEIKKGNLYDCICLQLNIVAWNGNDAIGPVEDETACL